MQLTEIARFKQLIATLAGGNALDPGRGARPRSTS